MNLSNCTKFTLCLALFMSLASCGSEEKSEKKPQDNQQVTQAVQPKAQDSLPKPQDSQPKAPAEKVKAQSDNKKWLPPAMADIGLTEEQEARIKPIAVESNKQLKAVREDSTLDSAAKDEKLRLIGNAMFEQYQAILTPEQWADFLSARQALMEKHKAEIAAKKEAEDGKE